MNCHVQWQAEPDCYFKPGPIFLGHFTSYRKKEGRVVQWLWHCADSSFTCGVCQICRALPHDLHLAHTKVCQILVSRPPFGSHHNVPNVWALPHDLHLAHAICTQITTHCHNYILCFINSVDGEESWIKLYTHK